MKNRPNAEIPHSEHSRGWDLMSTKDGKIDHYFKPTPRRASGLSIVNDKDANEFEEELELVLDGESLLDEERVLDEELALDDPIDSQSTDHEGDLSEDSEDEEVSGDDEDEMEPTITHSHTLYKSGLIVFEGPFMCISDPADRPPLSRYHPAKHKEIRRAYLTARATQPKFEFPVTNKRRFTGSYYKLEWLEYSIKKDAVFCLHCYLLTEDSETLFTVKGASDWRALSKKIRRHVGKPNQRSAH